VTGRPAVQGQPWARAAGAVLVVAAVAVGWAVRAGGGNLGAATAPFFWVEYPSLPPQWWAPLVPLAAALALGERLLRAGGTVGRQRFALSAFGVALLARAVLATTQGGIEEWWRPFSRPGGRATEYQAAAGVVGDDPLRFVDRFAELVPTLPVHPSGHPPGATLVALALDRAMGGIEGYAVALMVLGAATVWPLLAIARRLTDEASARRAVLLWAFAPSTLLYGATSFDGFLVLVAAATVAALVAARLALGAVAALAAFLLSYALALAPLWAALTVGGRRGLRVAVVCGAVALAGLATLALVAGYDPVGAVLATRDAYERGIGGQSRPLWYWVVAGPAVFLVMLGPVVAGRFLHGVEVGTPGARALAGCLALAAASGVMEAEVERIWQFAVPFAAVAAAPLVSPRAARVAILLAALQAYVIEIRWDTTF
jgi:hypothetical protein